MRVGLNRPARGHDHPPEPCRGDERDRPGARGPMGSSWVLLGSCLTLIGSCLILIGLA
ncbi:hypothetical protein ACWCOV_09565 [Kribbella sp. NPDC002412]